MMAICQKMYAATRNAFSWFEEASDILDVKAQLKRYRIRAEELQEKQRRRSLV